MHEVERRSLKCRIIDVNAAVDVTLLRRASEVYLAHGRRDTARSIGPAYRFFRRVPTTECALVKKLLRTAKSATLPSTALKRPVRGQLP